MRAPGRVNLIGEHTDYNHGLVLPAAIAAATTVTATRRDDRIVAMHSQSLGDAELRLDDLSAAQGFARYAAGTLAELAEIGLEPCGANFEISGDLPIRSGLSSSAALCVAFVLAFTALRDTTLPSWDVARIAQRAESRGAGVECGIMDPFAILFGEAGRALLLDTQTLSYEAMPIPKKARVILCDCAVRRRLESAPYRKRQAECAQALATLQRRFASVASLRDVTSDMLDATAADLPDDLLRRARHVVTENRRVPAFAAALRNGALKKAGQLMLASHESLRDDFGVSTPELNELVEIARRCPGVYGARMTGAGFGGCTVNLVDADHAAAFEEHIAIEYFESKWAQHRNLRRHALGRSVVRMSHAMDAWQREPHRRFNPLDGRWVLVSPHRTDRPWLGERVDVVRQPVPAYDPHCALCPGNARATGARNPHYRGVYVFDNDYPALIAGTPPNALDDGPFSARTERGACRVVCFSPRHDLAVSDLPQSELERVMEGWADQSAALSSLPFVRAVTAFENRGAMMGASNPHPHGQIWAESDVPAELMLECDRQRAYREAHGRCLLCEYLKREIDAAERVLYDDGNVSIVVPFWAVWPFETLVLPRRHAGTLSALAADVRRSFARAISDLTRRYDRLFHAPFPYSMGFHQQPRDDDGDAFHVHAHYYPPLLRDAAIRKHSVGYELLAQQQRDLTPENAARRLRDA